MTELWADYSWARPDVTRYQGVMRYLDADRGTRPDLTGAEVNDLHRQGKPIGLIWQADKGGAGEGKQRGADDAQRANREADKLGAPDTAAIFYTVDADLSPAQVAPYFDGVRGVPGRPVGIYGSARIVEWAHDVGIPWRWQTLAWSRGRISKHAHLYQRDHNVDEGSGLLDRNVVYHPFPAWQPPGKEPIMTRRSPSQYDWDKCEFDETLLTKHFTPLSSRVIKFVVIHHMVIPDRDPAKDDALDACYRVWQTREASAHYGVERGSVRQYVWDKDRAWATGNNEGNNHGISIEHANLTLDEAGTARDYLIHDETLATSARLVAAIHRYHKLGRPSSKTVRKHSSFKATGCPGPHFDRIWSDYIASCAAAYDGKPATPSKPAPKPTPEPKETDDMAINDRIYLTDATADAIGWGDRDNPSMTLGGVLQTTMRLSAEAAQGIKRTKADLAELSDQIDAATSGSANQDEA